MSPTQESQPNQVGMWMKIFWIALFGVLVGVVVAWLIIAPSAPPNIVRIIKLPNESVVYPPAAVVAKGGTIVFKTYKTGATITFTDIPSLAAVQLKDGETKVVSLSGVGAGLYRYDVLCSDSSHARGFSGPIIIIE